MSDRLLKESDVLKIAFQLPLVVISAFADAVKAIPSADRPQGEWIDGKCSLCGTHAPFWSMATTYYKSNFCPNCGARMKGADDENV